MISASSRPLLGLGGLFVGCCLLAAEPAPQAKIDLSEYRTVENAVTTRVRTVPADKVGQTGYLGLTVQRDGQGRVVVEEVQPASPADKAGLKKGDAIARVEDRPVTTPEAFRQWLQARGPGEAIKLGVVRGDGPTEVTAKLTATSQPKKPGLQRVFLGIELGEPKEGEGVRVEKVAPESPAASAGVKSGDYVAKLEGEELRRATRLTDLLTEKKPGDKLVLVLRRDGKDVEVTATLGVERGVGEGRRGGGGGAGGGGGGGRPGFGGGPPPEPTIWKKAVLRLAVVGIAYPDVKHNEKVSTKDWEEALFSAKSYSQKSNATGQPVHGSLNDYVQEQSAGVLRIEGKVHDWVQVAKKRSEYSQGSGTSNKTAPLVEALDKVTARDGKEAFKDADAFLFLYAGERLGANRGALYSPHAGSLNHQGRRFLYLLGPEGGSRMSSIGVVAKELGQMLGLPDLAARTENVGSEGLGAWCALSNAFGTARPQHFSAWAKEKLGWVKPAAIDPTVKQKLILAPIEDSPKECFKVLVRPDGSEYLLLENRRKKGFDADLPGEGLLIWRVVNDRPILEESHGIEGPAGPTTHAAAVPYPSPANNAFTPETTPSSRSPQGGGLPVHITEIRRLPDGRVAFQIGYEYR